MQKRKSSVQPITYALRQAEPGTLTATSGAPHCRTGKEINR